jgi:hypothetical protein
MSTKSQFRKACVSSTGCLVADWHKADLNMCTLLVHVDPNDRMWREVHEVRMGMQAPTAGVR